MEARSVSGHVNTETSPPFSSLPLLVPPLRLISVALWQLAQRRDVMHYGKLEEFVTLVTETVPELLTYRQRAQLVLGLRARLILELCCGEHPPDPQAIQAQLDRMRPSAVPKGSHDADVEASEANFVELVQTLLEDPAERERFFQEVFPVQFGPSYDSALQTLLWEFLCRLEQLLPVPDLKQTVSWLSDTPLVLEDCVQSLCHPHQLKTLLQHFRCLRHMDTQETALSDMGDRILCSLSIPPSTRAISSTEQTDSYCQPESIHDCMSLLGPTTVGVEVEIESVVEGMDYTVELTARLDTRGHKERTPENIVRIDQGRAKGFQEEQEDGGPDSDSSDVSRGWERLNEKPENGLTNGEDKGISRKCKNESEDPIERYETFQPIQTDRGLEDGGRSDCSQQEGEGRASKVTSCLSLQPRVLIRRLGIADTSEPALTPPCPMVNGKDQKAMSPLRQNNDSTPQKHLPESSENVNQSVASQSPVSPQKDSKGQSSEVPSQAVTCPHCPFVDTEEVTLHQHMERLHPEENSRCLTSAENGAENPLPPGSHAQTPQPDNGPASGPDTGTSGVHACSHCGKTFRTPSDLTRHQRTHTAERPFACSHCDKSFKHPWDRTRHQRTHTEELSFHCFRCGKGFRHLWSLTLHHQRTHREERQYYCPQCGKSFQSPSELSSHKQTHPAKRLYSCRQCGKSFQSLLERSEHRQTHAVKRQYKCSQCEKTYTRASDMRRHQVNHSGERPFQCSDCGKRFTLLSILTKHQQTHTGERPFHCSHCQKRFTRSSILTRHERIHTGERPYLCSQCGKSFLSLGELSKHQKWHTEERPYLCSHCGKGFKMKAALKKHQKTHTGERPYQCSLCEKAFTGVTGLSRHQLVHTGERPYSCSQCGKSFLSTGELVKHQRFHTGERPFQCSQCGKSFTQSCYLTVHRRTHTGERPYHCSQCRKSFSCSTQLKRHLRLHSGEKPFQCSECGKRFNRSCLLKTHQQTHTGSKT